MLGLCVCLHQTLLPVSIFHVSQHSIQDHLSLSLTSTLTSTSTQVSQHSIQDYLSRITCKRWVLDECCRRVPDDPDMVRA